MGNPMTDSGWKGYDRYIAYYGGNCRSQFAKNSINAIESNTNVFVLYAGNEISEDFNSQAGYAPPNVPGQTNGAERVNTFLREIQSYVNSHNLKNVKIYVATCGPTIRADGKYDLAHFSTFNNAVGIGGVTKLNPWPHVEPIEAQWPGHLDGHYSDNTSRKLYNWYISQAPQWGD